MVEEHERKKIARHLRAPTEELAPGPEQHTRRGPIIVCAAGPSRASRAMGSAASTGGWEKLAGEEDGTQVQSSWFKAQVRAPLSRSKRPYLTPLLRVAEVTPAADVRGRLPHALGSCAPAVCPHTIVSWRSLRRLLPLVSSLLSCPPPIPRATA